MKCAMPYTKTLQEGCSYLVTELRLTLCGSMDWSPPGSSTHENSPGKNAGMGCHALLQGIFPTQESNPCLLHCRQILYHLNQLGSLALRSNLSLKQEDEKKKALQVTC